MTIRLKALAAAAAKELRTRPLPEKRPKTDAFAIVIAKVIHKKGLRDFNEGLWRTVLALLGRHIENTEDVYFWVCGVAQSAAELAVFHSSEHAARTGMAHVQIDERVEMILRICDALQRITVQKRADKNKKKK